MKIFNQYKFFGDMDYTPHKGQQLFHDSKARFRVLSCGRRWGKSLSSAMEIAKAMVIKPDQLGWVVAPDYELSLKIFREVYWRFHKNAPKLIESSSLSKNNMHIKLINGSELLGKSADNPTSLIGEGLNFLVIDEASRIKSDCWFEALRPTLADKKGWALFISTPKGKNWFYELFMCGVNEEAGYQSWRFPSVSNPYLDPEEINQAKGKMPSMTFKQEFMAEFLESADAFIGHDLTEAGVREDLCMITKRDNRRQRFLLGVDCARMGEDESVLIVVSVEEPKNRVIYIESIPTNTTVELVGRVRYLETQFMFEKCFIDMTGLGAGVYDALNVVMPGKIEGITFTIKTKQDIYSNLKVMMEQARIEYPRHRKLIEQLKDLRYETASNGDLKIHHSDTGFDDFPDALALACYGIRQNTGYRPMIA